MAGFGWGAAWLDGDGDLELLPRHPRLPRRPGPASVGARSRRRALLVHLRRPSRFSTLTLPDTQPFDDPAGRFAFSHNGDLRDYRTPARTYRDAGRIHGRADTEVGARWLEDAWRPDEPAATCSAALHDRFGGHANLARPARPTATSHHYAGNDENPVFTFRLGRIGIVSTGIYSLDRSLFRFVGARRDRAAGSCRFGTTVALDRDGTAIAASS